MTVWEAKSFTKKSFLKEKQESGQILKAWLLWSSRFYTGCCY